MIRPSLIVAILLSVPAICPAQGISSISGAREAIERGRYADAVEDLEELAGNGPADPETRTYLATARLYRDRRFYDALKEFGEAFGAGGGASFVVAHSHEALTDSEAVDVCRGWLHLRAGVIEFRSADASHSFRVSPAEIKEFETNRLSKSVFHIQIGGKTWNFRPRTATKDEAQLVVTVYDKFVRRTDVPGKKEARK